MSFTFEEVEPESPLVEIKQELHFVRSIVTQYIIDSDTPISTYDFHDESKYNVFFNQFAEYANPLWKEKTGHEWDFSKFPYRESSDTIKGLFRIMKTGGAYQTDEGEPFDEEEASKREEKHRMALQKDSSSLLIFCVVTEDTRGEDVSGGFGVPDEMLDLHRTISTFYEAMAWDDLIFIINPKYNTLFVIAFTDTD